MIESGCKKLVLKVSRLRGKDVAYHFKTINHGSTLKAFCHTAATCSGASAKCEQRDSAELKDWNSKSLFLKGDNNTLNIHNSLFETTIEEISFTVIGNNNTVVIDASEDRYWPLKTLCISIQGRCSENYITSIVIEGRLQALKVVTNSYLRLILTHLKLQQDSSVTSSSRRIVEIAQPMFATPISLIQPSTSRTRDIVTGTTSERTENRRKRKNTANKIKETTIPAQQGVDALETGDADHILCKCPVCETQLPNAVCIPCGHVLCLTCAKFLKSRSAVIKCAITGCDKVVESVIRIYLSTRVTKGAKTDGKSNCDMISID